MHKQQYKPSSSTIVTWLQVLSDKQLSLYNSSRRVIIDRRFDCVPEAQQREYLFRPHSEIEREKEEEER